MNAIAYDLVALVARRLSQVCSSDLHGGKPEDYVGADWQEFAHFASWIIDAVRGEIEMDEFEFGITLQEAAFVHGAQSCREMLARFVENSPPTDLKVMAGSMRANWHPGWGVDPGPLKGSIPHTALGETPEFYERNFPPRDAPKNQGSNP